MHGPEERFSTDHLQAHVRHPALPRCHVVTVLASQTLALSEGGKGGMGGQRSFDDQVMHRMRAGLSKHVRDAQDRQIPCRRKLTRDRKDPHPGSSAQADELEDWVSSSDFGKKCWHGGWHAGRREGRYAD